MKSKQIKRAEAEARNEKFAALSVAEKLEKLEKAPGKSLRQKEKLSKQ